MVVIKGSSDTNIQDILNVISDFKISNINEITVGISKKEVDNLEGDGKKKKISLPLLEKM